MKLSTLLAVAVAGAFLFGTSLFSRDRETPTWAYSGAVAANLSEVAASKPAQATRVIPVEVAAAPEPSRPKAEPPRTATPAPQPALAAPVPRQTQIRQPRVTHASTCGTKTCGPARVRSVQPPRAATPQATWTAESPAAAEPIQFRLAERGL